MVLGETERDISLSVEGYRNVGGTMTKMWDTSRGECSATVDTTKMLQLTDADGDSTHNDLIVAKVCTEFLPWAGNVLGTKALGTDSIKMSEVIIQRPRISDTLTCYKTSSHVSTNTCSGP
jgi:hypothetical protein